MLRSLRVKNLAIVENIRVEFNEGLNVVTGETGAGKSIIAGALNLVLGERADRSLIRAGEDTCGVEAAFELADPSGLDALLGELGLEPCENGRLIVRRLVSASGGGKTLINDSPATLQALARIGNLLVDMHGPHDHQSLLQPESQLDILDAFGDLQELRSPYEAAYRELLRLQARRRELDGDAQTVAQQIDLLGFQVKEIEAARLDDTSEEELELEHSRVANAQRILELAEGVRQALTDDEASAFNRLSAVHAALGELSQLLPEGSAWPGEARSAAIQVQELSAALSRAVQGIEPDPGRLQWLEDRKALIHKLKRKYGGSLEAIRQTLERAREKLRELESRDEQIARIEKELGAARERVETAGGRLGKERRKAGKALAAAVTRHLQGLGFPHGVFAVGLERTEPGPSGLDAIEFGFAPNVGEPMRPLRLIASSGEISRVMLATKAVLAQHDRIPVLVFDEIDANVGGEMGNAIGEKLQAIAAKHQVLCVTHLPQVAVHGRSHFVVTKEVRDGRTRTQIRPVEQDERVEELARMLGGRGLTTVTLRHAREMLKQASVPM
jgi:DNA repair protein RecN (Recombination protein N)